MLFLNLILQIQHNFIQEVFFTFNILLNYLENTFLLLFSSWELIC